MQNPLDLNMVAASATGAVLAPVAVEGINWVSTALMGGRIITDVFTTTQYAILGGVSAVAGQLFAKFVADRLYDTDDAGVETFKIKQITFFNGAEGRDRLAAVASVVAGIASAFLLPFGVAGAATDLIVAGALSGYAGHVASHLMNYDFKGYSVKSGVDYVASKVTGN